jgi:TolA-binding protein
MASASPAQRSSCLWLEAGGSDLAAQNALYLLGAAAQGDEHDGRSAVSIWQTYLHRFPRGVLVGETTWAVFDELVSERRYEEALSISGSYLESFPGSAQATELSLRRGDLLAETLNRPLEAEQAYRGVLLGGGHPLLRDDALFKLGLCYERLGESAEARVAWQRYQADFPNGRHAAEVAERLTPAR